MPCQASSPTRNTVDPAKIEVLIDNLVKAGVDKIDYIVAHHGEQDHSGSIADILVLYPDAKVVTNPKCKSTLMDLLCIPEDKFITVDDGETLSLGDKTLQFVYVPWVHWPETLATYLREDKILFPCDFFGSHLASSSLFVDDEPKVYEAAKRYYAEIMMPFRNPIKNNLKKIDALDIEMIAPSHGPVHNKPDFIINAYKDWISDNVKNEVVLPYVSMQRPQTVKSGVSVVSVTLTLTLTKGNLCSYLRSHPGCIVTQSEPASGGNLDASLTSPPPTPLRAADACGVYAAN